VASQIVVSTSVLDKLFGEVILACSLLDKQTIFTKDNYISQILSGLDWKGYRFAEKETLLDDITGKAQQKEGGVRIDIDKACPVRGLGTVVLGIVMRGTVKVHDELYHSSGKKVLVRSIQSQDVDITEAGTGTRVGLVLKGIEHEEIEKGDILGASTIGRVASVNGRIEQKGFAKEEVAEGKTYEFVYNFSHAFGIVNSYKDGIISMKLEKQIALEPGTEFLLVRQKQPRIFASGRIINI
jgi:selenocysteine-specific translation elongation factor